MYSKIKILILISIISLYNCQNQQDECKLIKEKLVCSKLPVNCPILACEQLKEINFDSNIKKLTSNSFSNYELKDELTINLNNLMTIESDAFNGLVLHSNAQLNINILNLDFSNNNNNNNNNKKQVKSNLIIEKYALRGMLIEIGAKLTIHIRNFDLVEFKYNSILNQLKQYNQSQVFILIEDSTDVVFKSGNANLVSKSSDPLSLLGGNTNLMSSQFKININKCKDIVFEKESFASQTQSPSSLFQLTATQFDDCRLGRLSFSQLKQSESSYFELNLSGKRLTLSEQAFSLMKQNTNSQFIIFTNLSESSSVCLKPKTFADITQGLNSTVRISFQLNNQNDFVMQQNSIENLKQNVTSQFQVYILKPINVQLESESVSSLDQDTLSNFELWVNKAKSNFILDQNSFSKINQAKESTIQIGYVSSQDGSVYYQSPNTFSQLKSEFNSQIIYDFSPGTKFSLKYAARPMPRMMPNIKNSNLTIEEQLFKMFPNLGRQSRPDLLNLNEYKLEANDFCSISEIPFDVLVKLRPDTDCSCSVYYLYRSIRKIRNDTDNKWVLNAPECYQKKVLASNNDEKLTKDGGLNDMNNLNELENMCKFKEMIANCKSMSDFKPSKQVNSSQLKECENSFDYFESAQKTSNDETYEIYEDDTYPDDTNENKDSLFDNFTYDDEDDDDDENAEKNDANIEVSKEFSDYIYDDDDDNDEDDEDDNNEFNQDGNLIEEINAEPSNKILPPQKIDTNKKNEIINNSKQLTKWHILFISGLSMILVTILISVMIIICKLKGRRGAKSLSTNDDSSCSSGDEEEDDDNIDDNDQHDLVTISNNTKESIFKPITNKFKKKTKKFAYSHFNQKSNSALSNLIENDSAYSISNNKHLLVQCDRNSIVSSFASSTASTLNNTVSEKNEQTENNNNNNNKKTIYKQITKSESELSLEDKIKINYNIYN